MAFYLQISEAHSDTSVDPGNLNRIHINLCTFVDVLPRIIYIVCFQWPEDVSLLFMSVVLCCVGDQKVVSPSLAQPFFSVI